MASLTKEFILKPLEAFSIKGGWYAPAPTQGPTQDAENKHSQSPLEEFILKPLEAQGTGKIFMDLNKLIK